MSDKQGHVFLHYSAKDRGIVERIAAGLMGRGVTVWMDAMSIRAGAAWGDAIEESIRQAAVVVALISEAWESSAFCRGTLDFAIKERRPIISVLLDDSNPPLAVVRRPSVKFEGDVEGLVDQLVDALEGLVDTRSERETAQSDLAPARPAAKGYVFMSYVGLDKDFVDRLKGVLEKRGYAYWDYRESERDYHSALYRELEERIENAAAFISVVSDAWRDTEWTAGEYIYAREAEVPVFVIQCRALKRPLPILLNQQTRIDMATDFARGAMILERELEKKGL